jgi:hypothetical protein
MKLTTNPFFIFQNRENKFDLAKKEIKLLNNNYLD